MKHRCAFTSMLALAAVLMAPSALRAEVISINAPNFLIPLASQTGELTLFSDGRAPVVGSGFNPLGDQTFVLGAGHTSTGTLRLNLVFSGFPLGTPLSSAWLQFSVYDLDFVTDQITSTITLDEFAVIDAVNGSALPLLPHGPIDLEDYLPTFPLPNGTTTTDDETIHLLPIHLTTFMDPSNLTDPFTLSLTLTASATNHGGHAVTLLNTPESLVSNIKLQLEPVSVPEPSTMLSLSLVSLGLVAFGRRRESHPAARAWWRR